MPRTLVTAFLHSCANFGASAALDVKGQQSSYQQLGNRAKSLGATVSKSIASEVALTAILAHGSETAYAGILGALMAGNGYVPLNPRFPIERTRLMLERSMCRSLIVDAHSESQLQKLLIDFPRSLVVICPDQNNVSELAKHLPKHQVIGAKELADADEWKLPSIDDDAIAYLLFTSGSTGQPKGVIVSQGNVLHYVDYVTRRYGIQSNDRLSQTFELTFDLSAHDMFVSWANGACLCVPTQKQMIKPGAFINQARLTQWFSVPSTIIFMRRLGELKPGSYPHLRLSLFCGEALPVEVARAWSAAAPTSVVENIYGPTELTIGCTAYRWDDQKSPSECEHGIVAIGEPFEDMEALIVDEELREVPLGSAGELIMTGPQLSQGYWNDEEKTKLAFVSVPGRNSVYYRTGDRVRRSAVNKPITYLGRLDTQVKVLGHRVEIGEVEAVARNLSGLDGVVAIAWPNPTNADGIELFLETDRSDTEMLRRRMKEQLPYYMVPRTIRTLSRLPLNSNGKYDRGALRKLLGGG